MEELLRQLQEALDAGGLPAFRTELTRLTTATRGALQSQQGLSRAIQGTARTQLVATLAARDSAARQQQIDRGRLDLEVRRRTLASAGAAAEVAALREVARARGQVARDEERVRLSGRRGDVKSGAFLADAGDRAQLRNEHDRVGLAERRAMLDSGGYAADAVARQQLDADRARLDLAERRARVESGAYAAQLRASRQLLGNREKVERMERRTELRERYGRLVGAAVERGGPLARVAGAALTTVGGAINAGALSGFQGTVEMNRFLTELQLVNRELAGAFRPALMEVTRIAQQGRKWLERRSPEEQDMIETGGLAVGGGVGAAFLLRKLGIGPGAAGRFALGVGQGGGVASLAGPVGLAATLGYLAPEHVKDGGLGRMSREQLQDRLAEEKKSSTWAGRRLRNTFGSVGAGFFDAVNWTQKQFTGQTYKRDEFRAPVTAIENELEKRQPQGPNPNRRTVTPADAGFQAIGSGFERVTNALAVRDATDAEGKGADKNGADVVKLLEKIAENLDKLAAAQNTPQIPRR